jgi:hypothetical protein
MSSTTKVDDLTIRISKWVVNRFGRRCLLDPRERAMRLLEEAIELAQAEDISLFDASKVAVRVYERPKGEKKQEAAGVAVTLLAYCRARRFDFLRITDREVTRVESIDPEISRAKHAAKVHAGTAIEAKP